MTTEQRHSLLANSDREPKVKEAHPRIEHYLPILVAMAAAGYSTGKVIFSDVVMGDEALLEHYLWR